MACGWNIQCFAPKNVMHDVRVQIVHAETIVVETEILFIKLVYKLRVQHKVPVIVNSSMYNL